MRGQLRAISEAQAVADVPADTIGYVETHGTGTRLGDPIEFEALTRAFRQQTKRTQYCAIGSVKTNVGHLDEAAGVTGLIKTVLSLHYRQIPPSLHFETANPELGIREQSVPSRRHAEGFRCSQPGHSAPCRREFVWDRWDERTRDIGGGAAQSKRCRRCERCSFCRFRLPPRPA